jgi:hypothetical protein
MTVSPRFRELVRHFLMRFYDNDLLSPDRDQLPGLASLLGLLAAPGIVIPLWLMIKFSGLGEIPISVRDMMSLGEKFLFVTLSLTSIGFVTVLEWDALFPDRRDYLVLCPLPLPLRTIFGAKICSLVLFIGIFLAAVTSLTPVLLPSVVLGSAPLMNWVWFCACHLFTAVAACLFTFLLMIAIQGVFLNLLPYRLFHKISPWLQLACLVGLLLQFLLSARAFSLLNYEQARNHWTVYLSPPMWFLGLYQYELGWDKPVFRDLARIGLQALGGVAVLAVCSYALAYKRHVKRCLEAAEIEAGAPGPVRRMFLGFLEAVAVRRPLERAVFQFTTLTLSRSRKHRLYVSACAGLALAAIFEVVAAVLATKNHAWLYRPNRPLLWIPFILLFVLLPGLCHTYAIPSELKANWIFRMAEPHDREQILRGIRRATLVLGVLPVYIGLLPVYAWLWGPLNAVLHTVVGISVALIARDVLLLRFHKIPFTCSYLPGQAKVKAVWALYVFFFVTLVSALAVLELWMLARPWRLVFLLAALAVSFCARAWFARRDKEPLVFDEQPEPVVRELGLVV